MAIRIEPLAVSLPGLCAMRWSSDAPSRSMKEGYCIGRVERGRAEWWTRGRTYRSAPGAILLLQPGDVRRDVSMDGPTTIQVVSFAARDLEEYERASPRRVRIRPQLAADDERAAAFLRLHAALDAAADRLTLEVVVAEAIDALCAPAPANEGFTRPVRRALELLRAQLADAITLDQLAAHAGLDKFHLCRAFRAQIGMPPHAYRTHLRIARAKELLTCGTRPRDVAPQVGLYDQSQLNRHFRRIVGTTPGQYALNPPGRRRSRPSPWADPSAS